MGHETPRKLFDEIQAIHSRLEEISRAHKSHDDAPGREKALTYEKARLTRMERSEIRDSAIQRHPRPRISLRSMRAITEAS